MNQAGVYCDVSSKMYKAEKPPFWARLWPVVSNLLIETDILKNDKQDQIWPRYVNSPFSPITQATPFWYH